MFGRSLVIAARPAFASVDSNAADSLFAAVPLPGVMAAVVVVALSYGGAGPVPLFLAVASMAAIAWLQSDRANVYIYLALLGVQFSGPDGLFTLPFRVAASDFFLLPVIARSAWAVLCGRRIRVESTMWLLLMALLVVMAISTIIGVVRTGQLAPWVWFNKGAGILFLVAGFWVLSAQLQSGRDVRRALGIFVAGASVANAFALLATIASLTVWPNPVFNIDSGRLFGWMFSPNSFGCLVTIAVLLELGRRHADRESSWVTVGRSVNIALLLLSIGITFARSVWIGLAVGGLVLLVTQFIDRRQEGWRWPVAVATCLTILAPAAGMAFVVSGQWQRVVQTIVDPGSRVTELKTRLDEGNCSVEWDPELCSGVDRARFEELRAHRLARHASGSAPAPLPVADVESAMMNSRGLDDRAAILAAGWGAYTETRLSTALGIGLGTFYATSGAVLGIPAIIHNTGAWFLVEMGPLGLLVLIWILARTAWSLWRVRAGTSQDADLARGLLAALAFWVVVSMFNEAFYLRTLWLVLVCADRLFVFDRAVLAYHSQPQPGTDNPHPEQGATI